MKKLSYILTLCFSILFFVSCCDKQAKTDSYAEYQPTGNEIKLVVDMKFKPEYKDELVAVYSATIDETRKEKGCIYYDLHQDISDSLRYVLLEYWESEEDLANHLAADHLTKHRELTKGKIESSILTKIKQVY